MEVFSSWSAELHTTLGDRLAVHDPSSGVGEQWCRDVVDTAWRIIVTERIAETPLPSDG